jgi:hypothetical protein
MKKILFFLSILIIILIVLSTIWRRTVNLPEALQIINDDRIHTLSWQKLQQLPTCDFQTERGDSFSGYKLSDILALFELDGEENITFHSIDGGSLRLKRSEFGTLYLVLMDTEKELRLRLIIPEDEFGQRWMKYVNRIVLE